MPGQSIGASIPSPNENVFSATIIVQKRDGKYSHKWNFSPGGDPFPIAQRMQQLLDQLVDELNAPQNVVPDQRSG
jgi:hypothetical protein